MATNSQDLTLPVLTVAQSWQDLLSKPEKSKLEGILPQYLLGRRWFGGKARTIQSVTIIGAIPIPEKSPEAYLSLIQVSYGDGAAEVYRLPVTFVSADEAPSLQDASAAIARVVIKDRNRAGEGVLYDAMWMKPFLKTILRLVAHGVQYRGPFGDVTATPTPSFKERLMSVEDQLEPSVMKAEQSNTSVVYGKQFILKLYRRAENGINPDLEIGRFLTQREFPNIAQVASALEHRAKDREFSTVMLLQTFLPNKGDAWRYTLESLAGYFAETPRRRKELLCETGAVTPLLEVATQTPPSLAKELIGPYLDHAALLGLRTGELHVALSLDTTHSNFAPEPFSDSFRHDLLDGINGLITRIFALLQQRVEALPSPVQTRAKQALNIEKPLKTRVQSMRERSFTCMLIRCHGDYHLGQVLYTGQDFVIIDFEGEPARPLAERRMKGSPLRDVAGMLRSFHYAAYAALMGRATGVDPEDFAVLEPAARFWYQWVAATYLRSYLDATGRASFIPQSTDELSALLELFLLEKATYELGYELNNRPDWVKIPLEGILTLMEGPS